MKLVSLLITDLHNNRSAELRITDGFWFEVRKGIEL